MLVRYCTVIVVATTHYRIVIVIMVHFITTVVVKAFSSNSWRKCYLLQLHWYQSVSDCDCGSKDPLLSLEWQHLFFYCLCSGNVLDSKWRQKRKYFITIEAVMVIGDNMVLVIMMMAVTTKSQALEGTCRCSRLLNRITFRFLLQTFPQWTARCARSDAAQVSNCT